MVQLQKALWEFTLHPNRRGSQVTYIVSSSSITPPKYGFKLCSFTFKILPSLRSSNTTAPCLNTSLTMKGPSYLGFNLPEPKYAYLRPPGSRLSSSCGASSLECTSFFSFSSSSSKQGFHPSLIAIIYCSSKNYEESNKEKLLDTWISHSKS